MLLFCAGARADEISDLKQEIRALKSRIGALEERLAEEEKAKSQSGEEECPVCLDGGVVDINGLKIGASATFVVQNAIDVNNTDQKDEDVADANYSVDITFSKEFGDYAKASMKIETGDGANVTDELMLYSGVNEDADDLDNVAGIAEVWYEHYLFDDQFTFTFGKFDTKDFMDQNEIACDECYQFLAAIFKHSQVVEFPDNNIGLAGVLTPESLPWIEFSATVTDGNGDWEEVFGNIFAGAQVNIKPEFNSRRGNYRFFGWFSDVSHTEWLNMTDDKEHIFGFGVSADQEITDIFSVFGRYSWKEPDVFLDGNTFSLEQSWSAGCRIFGEPWNRPKDHVACAVGMEMPSDDYAQANMFEADDEGHFEAYYSFYVNDHLIISPDYQLIWNAFGSDIANREDTISVIGLRAQVDF
jgi:hypothetical protein